jgi:hypothetical protein
MNLDTDILERPAPVAPRDPDPRVAVAVRWICMLRGLSEIGARVVAFLAHEIAPRPDGPKGPTMVFRFRGDPIAAFERVWRAVRLALSLCMRIQDEIGRLKAGKPLGPDSIFSQAPRAKTGRMTELSEAVRKKARLGDDALETALQEITEAYETPEFAESLIDNLEADLREDAAFHRLLNGPLKDAVAAICADLGLKPDWSLWTEDGFPPPPGGEEEDWIDFFLREADTGPAPPRERPPPQTPPRSCVRDPHHVLDPPRRDLNAFLAAHGINPLPPPPGQRSACTLPRFVLRPPRGRPGLPKSL